MEKKEKAWKRRGLFALVSNRGREYASAGDEPHFPEDEDDPADPDDESTPI